MALIANRIGVTDILSIPIIIAAAKKAGHQVLLVDHGRDPERAVDLVKGFAPDILAYSVMSPDAKEYLAINAKMKAATGAYTIMGGVHPTFDNSFLDAPGIDAICVGEGDQAFPEFLDAFGTEAMYAIPNMHYRLADGTTRKNAIRPLVEDLDSLPFPDKEAVYAESFFQRGLPIRLFSASRGCPYNCSYCFNHSFNEMYKGLGKVLRTKSVPYLIAEIKQVISRHPTKFLRFHDDIFGANRKWLDEFAEVYPREIGLPFSCYARPNMISDGYCAGLKKAGCHSVVIAIEAGNEQIRADVMRRKMSNDKIIAAFKTLRQSGLRTYCLNMMGLPGEAEEHFLETIKINQDCKVDYADCSIFQPYPGTDITQYCLDNGYLQPDKDSWGGQYSGSVLNFPEPLKRRMETYQILFPLLVEYPWIMRHIPLATWINGTRLGKMFFAGLYRLAYGFILHRRIYPVGVPLKLKAWAAWTLLTSKTRN